jgi:hypothetical protein
MTKKQVFSKAFKFNLALGLFIAAIGSALGWMAAESAGVFGALIGAGVTFGFGLLTLLSIQLGSKLPLGGFYGLVLGGWLLKVLLFAILIGSLRGAEWLHGPSFFFAIVASVLGSLSIDSWVVLKGRIETFQS